MTQQTQQSATSLSYQLNDIGEKEGIPRNDGEDDADYAERMVYELDVMVEQLWAAQDKIRELVPVDEFRLVVMSKNVNTGTWNDQQVLVDPGRSYYAHWYQKLAIDAWGRLFVNYQYYPDNLFSDEAAILNNTFGLHLANPVDYAGATCVPTNHDATPATYCAYAGDKAVTNAVLMSRGLGQLFQLATTKSFFQF